VGVLQGGLYLTQFVAQTVLTLLFKCQHFHPEFGLAVGLQVLELAVVDVG